MTLLNAPAYDPRHEKLVRNSIIAVILFIVLAILIGVGGYIAGHGWFFSNLSAEHKVSSFLTALENKDYTKAYGIFYNDADWQQHPQKYSGYPLQRFTEDWTTYSPVKGPITSHKIAISKTDGSGAFGSGIIVAAHLNNRPTCAFLYVIRANGNISYPALHEIGYDGCNNTQ